MGAAIALKVSWRSSLELPQSVPATALRTLRRDAIFPTTNLAEGKLRVESHPKNLGSLVERHVDRRVAEENLGMMRVLVRVR